MGRVFWPLSLVSTGSKNVQGSLKIHLPGDVDLDELANLTASSLKVLQPWCLVEHQSDVLRKITVQAHTYTQAIHSSISAAQQGFNVAQDALTLSNSVSSGDQSKEQIRDFAYSMLLLGQKAHSEALECLDKFRDVRQKLQPLIDDAKSSSEHSKEFVDGKLKPLEDGIPVFENLMKNVSAYISWWNWLELSTNSQVQSSEQLSINYSAMRKQKVATKWVELKEAFVQYREKARHLYTHEDLLPADKVLLRQVEKLEDAYPELFGSLKESAQTPVASSDLSSDYIKHHSTNPRPKSNSTLGSFFPFKSLFSHFRLKRSSVLA